MKQPAHAVMLPNFIRGKWRGGRGSDFYKDTDKFNKLFAARPGHEFQFATFGPYAAQRHIRKKIWIKIKGK
jgi:hypothetical protein